MKTQILKFLSLSLVMAFTVTGFSTPEMDAPDSEKLEYWLGHSTAAQKLEYWHLYAPHGVPKGEVKPLFNQALESISNVRIVNKRIRIGDKSAFKDAVLKDAENSNDQTTVLQNMHYYLSVINAEQYTEERQDVINRMAVALQDKDGDHRLIGSGSANASDKTERTGRSDSKSGGKKSNAGGGN